MQCDKKTQPYLLYTDIYGRCVDANFFWLKFNYFINLFFYHCVIDAWDHGLGQKVSVFTFNGKCIIVKPLRSLRYMFLLAFLALTVHRIQYAL